MALIMRYPNGGAAKQSHFYFDEDRPNQYLSTRDILMPGSWRWEPTTPPSPTSLRLLSAPDPQLRVVTDSVEYHSCASAETVPGDGELILRVFWACHTLEVTQYAAFSHMT